MGPGGPVATSSPQTGDPMTTARLTATLDRALQLMERLLERASAAGVRR